MALTIPGGTYRKWGIKVLIVPPEPYEKDKLPDESETTE